MAPSHGLVKARNTLCSRNTGALCTAKLANVQSSTKSMREGQESDKPFLVEVVTNAEGFPTNRIESSLDFVSLLSAPRRWSSLSFNATIHSRTPANAKMEAAVTQLLDSCQRARACVFVSGAPC